MWGFKRLALLGAAAGAAMAVAQPSSAALLDFTDASTITTLPNGSAFGTAYSVTVTGGKLTTNLGTGSCPASSPLACHGDGLGMNDDEITGRASALESITVSFADPVTLIRLYLLDLFTSTRGTEQAIFFINGDTSTSQSVFGTETLSRNGSGYLAVNLGVLLVNSITFTAPNITGDDGSNDYAVAALESGSNITVIPLPAPFALFLGALGGFGVVGWRRSKSAPA